MHKQTRVLLMLAVCVLSLAYAAAAQRSRPSVHASEVNGSFRMKFRGRHRNLSSDIKILALGNGKLRIHMGLVYPYADGNGMVNTGELDGTAKIVGEVATYQSTEFGPCTIKIKFVRPGVIKVSQDGTDADCGFGHNVMSDGTYLKVSSAKPKFN